MPALPDRLQTGRFYLGPDFHGCVNTGHAPAILKCRLFHEHPALARGFRFVVGPHLYCEEAAKALAFDHVPQGRTYYEPRGANSKRYRVRFFKTAAAAKKHFAMLVREAETVNARVRAEERTLRRKAHAGDIGAALALLDH